MLTAITLMTFNFWGLPPVGTFSLSLLKEERVSALCQKLQIFAKTKQYDIIALQEVWELKDRDLLKRCGYATSIDLDDPNRMIDSGLLILSRYPVAETAPLRVRYPKAAANHGFDFDGESAADKSVLIARFKLPDGRTFVVGDTHLVSRYSSYPEYDRYEGLRKQEFEIAKREMASFKLEKDEPAFLLGDFNWGPLLDGRENIQWTSLTKDLFYDRALSQVCTVCSSNPFQDGLDERMDFVFSLSSSLLVRDQEARALDQKVKLSGSVTEYLSDHFGWSARYLIRN